MTIAKKSHHDDNLNITIKFMETGISLYEDFTVMIFGWTDVGVRFESRDTPRIYHLIKFM